MGFYALSALINGLSSSALGIFVYLKNKKGTVNRTYGLTTIFIGIWSYSYFFWQIAISESSALFWCRVLMAGAIFIPPAYLHFVLALLGLHKEKKKVVISSYIFGSFFFVLNFTSLFVKGVSPKLFFKYWPNAGITFLPFLFLYSICVIYAIIVMVKEQKRSGGIKRAQIRYVILGAFLGFGGGATNYPLWYDIPIPPVGNILVSVGIVVMAYAIIKYQLMDIKVAITRGGIFLFVYAFILGIPFAIGYHTKSWFLPAFLMAVLASWGPFIYGRLRKKAEDIILAHQRKYQKILLQAAEGMSRQRNLNHLLKLIVYIIKKTVNPAFAAVFFQENGNFYIKAARGIKREHMDVSIARDSPLMQYIFSSRRPLNVEEMPPAARQYLENIFSRRIELVIPAFIEDSLVAFMVLGNKKDGTVYSASDMEVFEILSHQASLAMENCLLWEKERKRLVRREQELRMASLDHFSASLAHEIDNPIQAISGMAELALSHLDSSPDFYLRDKLQRIVNNSCRVSRIIKAIREFSSQTEGEHTILRIEDVISGFEEVISPQLKIHRVILEKEIERDLPPIKGNKIHLEEVLVNLASNSIHALEKKEKKVIRLRVYKKDPKTLRIEFSDNGYGIEKKMLSDIFLDFVTTKASTEGQGLGLARVRKIITQHSGRIWAESEGKDKGATFFIELPLAS